MGLESIAMFVIEKAGTFITNNVGGALCDPIRKPISNMYHFKSNVDELRNKAGNVERKKKGVEHDVEDAKNEEKSIKEEVTEWLRFANDVTEKLANRANEGNLAWHTGFFRYSDSMEAAALVEEVSELLKTVLPANVGNYNPPQRTRSMYVRDDEKFSSREKIFSDVMEALKNYNIKVIGLHGMGGVGKTTLVRKVYWQLTEVNGLFDQVAMAEVSQNPDPIKVQGAIAESLGLKLQGETLDKRASQLHQWLKEKKSVLIILDDVWKEFGLKAIGIPFGNADQRHCRILVTSRDQRVCNIMKSEKNICVETFSDDEAWILFWKEVGDAARQSEFETLAKTIVNRCGGLPVAIVTVAKILKNSDRSSWEEVSNGLENIDYSGVEEDFYSVIEWSYKKFKNKEAKSLFLLCGLHEVGHPILIDHLVRCVIGWGFLPFITSLKVMRGKVDQLIKVLKDVNLLLEIDDRKGTVKVHDVIHVVARRIAAEEQKMFNIQDVVHLNEELEKDIYKDSTAISLHQGEVPVLPEKVDFPQLKLLLLNSEREYFLQIPDTFFDEMKELRVLVLNGVSLQSFISSLNYESNIRTLSLEHCHLKNMTKVGLLKKLEVLTVSGTDVKTLPEEIGDLTRLKLLDLERCSELEVILPNVISKLTRLEELYVSRSFVNWDTLDNARLIELKQLGFLNILNIHIMDARIILQDFFPEKLEKFKILIGKVWYWSMFDKREMSRVLKLKLSYKNFLQCGMEKLLQKTEGLFLDEIDGIRNVHPNLGGKGFPDLKYLCIRGISHLEKLCDGDSREKPFRILKGIDVALCPHLKFMFSSSMVNGLQQLEEIRVEYCESMEVIIKKKGSNGENNFNSISFFDEKKLCHVDSREEPFRKLRVIVVERCATLTQLISSSMTRLEEIEVIDCENLAKIVGNDVPDDRITISNIVFTELRTLTLRELPKLMNFGPTAISRTLENTQEGDHEDLKSLFDNKVSFPSLKNLSLSSLNIPNIWCNQLPRSYSFGETLTSLKVEHCPHLKFLFSSSMVNGLQQLETLEVVDCESMEVIINKEGSGGENNFNSILDNSHSEKLCDGDPRKEPFRKLKVIVVRRCAALTELISFSMTCLEEITVQDCENLKFMFSSSMVNSLQQLEEIWVIDCKSIEVIIKKEGSSGENNFNSPSLFDEKKLYHDDSREEPFRKLRVIVVQGCAALTQLLSSSMTHLEEIKVIGCENVTEIVGNDVPDDDITISEIVFTELRTLHLQQLPKLMNFGPTSISRTLENTQEGDHEDLKSLSDNKVSFPSLKELNLCWLNNWCNQLPSSYSFGETLTSLDVYCCPHLKFLFSSSMVNGLQQLENLVVGDCELMEVVINKEGSGGENNFNSIPFFDEKVCDSVEEIFDVPEGSSSIEGNTIPMIIFPKLTRLSLFRLTKLKRFYNGLHISEWPSLKQLSVNVCHNVEIFGSDYQSFCEEKQSIPQPLFIVDKDTFPRLKVLELGDNDNLKEIWHGGGIISKELRFDGKTNIIKFPHYLLATDALEVSSGYFKQIGGGSDNTFAAALSQLRTLRVSGDDDDDDDSLYESFESSDSLACLVSSWVSFQNLTKLDITCGFRYLLTYSTATSLQHLTQLKISDCKQIEVIIMPPTNEVNDKVVFSQLKNLRLINLDSLTSFYSGSHTLEFPSLEKMVVCRCPNMKVFSEGDSITQKLQRIQLHEYYDHDRGLFVDDYDEWRWEGDLNSTIQKMRKEMAGFKGLKEFWLSKFPWLKEVWHDQVSFNSFPCLESLTVDKCADISSAIPLNLLPCLKSLYRLTIEDCDSLEEVIHTEGLDDDDQSVLLPWLHTIQLIELPRLRNVWSKHHLEILGFTHLSFFSVSKCNNLQYIFTTKVILNLKLLVRVEIRDCAMLETIITEDREKDATMSDIVLPWLRFITLEYLPKLTCFHSGSNILKCSVFETMTINDCPQMKAFVFTSTEDHDLQNTPLFSEKVAFPNLKKLELSKLPMVEHLWNEPCRVFQCLETIEISECVILKSLVPSSTSLQSLTTLKVSQCDGLTSLMTLPTAKSLEQLDQINVADCKNMQEIITHIHIEDEENDRVVFGQLDYIGLHCLPNITGFYLGDYTIEFPDLEQVVVSQCQKMNTFSKGAVSTPILKMVQRTDDEEEGRWQNDLNTTIQLLFEETNAQNHKED